MRIEFLYFKGCPNSAQTLRLLFEVLAAEDIAAEVDEIEITDAACAARYRFLGSPSIRVEDRDIDPAVRTRRDYALVCRIYPGGTGVPPTGMIQRALQQRRSGEKPGVEATR